MIITLQNKKEWKKRSLTGLTAQEVADSRQKHGANVLPKAKRKSFFRQFISNLGDPVIKILIGALIINLIFMSRDGKMVESIGIAISILLATFISTASEYGSQSAFERLEESSTGQRARVIRDGVITEIPVEEIVVGDLALIGAGEQIPADGVLISGELSCDQSAMTGESREVYKKPIFDNEEAKMTPASSHFCVRGCAILQGEGKMTVTAVGGETFLGGISREIQADTRESPLKIRLSRLAKQISAVGYFAAVIIALVYLLNVFFIDSAFDTDIIRYKIQNLPFLLEHLLNSLTLGLTVVVVAVPEGLPMMIAVVLSANVKKMVKSGVLVRKPVGIEAAGSMNILFTDKTGTLTEGILSAGEVILGDGESLPSPSSMSDFPIFEYYVQSAYYNSTSSVGIQSGKKYPVGGNSTDRAILSSVIKRAPKELSVLRRIPFDSDKKYSAALVGSRGSRTLYVKGAPERILPFLRSYIDKAGRVHPISRQMIESVCLERARLGKRVIFIAMNEQVTLSNGFEKGSFGELTLICALTLEDKIRKSAPNSVKKLKRAGIHTVMITGDGKDTAKSIALKCGILDGEVDLALTGEELQALPDARLKELLPRLGVVARALPTDKSRLVRIAQENGLVVGMTGDGVNDAPALKRADVGFAMGGGAQVAKDAGDIIILDNDLATICQAVLYGRNIFKSIRKFISLQLMMNFCAVGVSMIGPFLGFDAPVTVVQMLWINIIMDTLGGLAFAGEPALESCMDERPKRRDEPILNPYMIYEIIFGGGFTVALCIAFLKIPEITSIFRVASDRIYLLTAFFALFIFASVFNCFCARSDRLRLLANITKNKAFIGIMAAILFIQILFVYLGGSILRTAPLTPMELSSTLLLALLVFPADMLRKLIWRILMGKKGY